MFHFYNTVDDKHVYALYRQKQEHGDYSYILPSPLLPLRKESHQDHLRPFLSPPKIINRSSTIDKGLVMETITHGLAVAPPSMYMYSS